MKKTILLTSMLLALTVSVALAAGGFSLNWGTVCYTEAATPALVFACATNSGTAGVMTTTFMLDNPMADLVGCEWQIDGQSDDVALPEWWKLGAAPDCRANKASFKSAYVAVATEACVDWTDGQGFNAPNFTWTGNRVRLTLGIAIDASTPFGALASQEYYSGGVDILNSKTVGTGACAGCSIGMIFAENVFTAAGLDGRRDEFIVPMTGGNRCLSWNNPTTDCTLVPARPTTWGQIKGLYR